MWDTILNSWNTFYYWVITQPVFMQVFIALGFIVVGYNALRILFVAVSLPQSADD